MKYYEQKGDEFTKSELPALVLLHEGLGYDYMQPSEIKYQLREKDTDVVLYKILERQLPKLNPWMKDHPEAIQQAIEKIREENFAFNLSHTSTNEKIHAMFTEKSDGSLKPLYVHIDLGNGGEDKNVSLFNFDEPENNHFLVTNQYTFRKHHDHIKPDITIFVNGFPLVIIECKDPAIVDPINEAVNDNLSRYQTANNGADRLFFYNLFLIATCGIKARHGCIDANVNFYSRWSSTYPYSEQEVANLAKRTPREQENLIAGMLNKKTLIDILENYVIYDREDNKIIKKIPKHQQFRTVSKAIKQLEITIHSNSQLGGTVWHSQGSGKSLTMFWLAKKIQKEFTNMPILVITDRISLDSQIHKNFVGAGWNKPIRVSNTQELKDELKSPEGKLVTSTIFKAGENIGILTDKPIIVLTDESHRTEFGEDATRMRDNLPKGIFFAFTATPTFKGKRNVYDKFGGTIDEYTWAESIEDESTVGIEIRPRWATINVDFDEFIKEFEKNDEFKNMTKEQKDQLREKLITSEKLRRATKRIEKNSKLIVDDFNARVGINNFKAMIVAANRESAVKYKESIDNIKDAPKSIIIMSESKDDPPSWEKYYLSKKQREQQAEEFTRSDNENKILIVSDMLLTGYDAPIIQTMYLDEKLKEHTLLQAIARVNRKYTTKQYGTIVDLVNISDNLDYAKTMFDTEKTRNLTFDSSKLKNDLKALWVRAMLDVKGIDPTNDEEILERFRAINKRTTFFINYKKFEKALDAVMPDPDAAKYLDDYAKLTCTFRILQTYFADEKFDTKPYSNQIQQLIDKHVSAGKIIIPIENYDYDDENFGKKLSKMRKSAQNAAMEGQIKETFRLGKPDNPIFFGNLEEQLRHLLEAEESKRIDAEQLLKGLTDLLKQCQEYEQKQKELGLENEFEFAIFGELKTIISEEKICIEKSKLIFEKISPLTEFVDWINPEKIGIKKDMQRLIYESLTDKFPEEKIDELTDKIIDLAKRHLYAK